MTNPATDPKSSKPLETIDAAPAPAPVAFLTRDAILDADDFRYRDVVVDEWGGMVRCKALNGRERAKWQEATTKMARGGTPVMDYHASTVTLIKLGVIHAESKTPVFSDDDLRALLKKNSRPLEMLAGVIMELSGIGEDEVDALRKNSKNNLSDDSDTD